MLAHPPKADTRGSREIRNGYSRREEDSNPDNMMVLAPKMAFRDFLQKPEETA